MLVFTNFLVFSSWCLQCLPAAAMATCGHDTYCDRRVGGGHRRGSGAKGLRPVHHKFPQHHGTRLWDHIGTRSGKCPYFFITAESHPKKNYTPKVRNMWFHLLTLGFSGVSKILAGRAGKGYFRVMIGGKMMVSLPETTYPLVNVYITIWKITIWENQLYKWPFSIAMLVITRG